MGSLRREIRSVERKKFEFRGEKNLLRFRFDEKRNGRLKFGQEMRSFAKVRVDSAEKQRRRTRRDENPKATRTFVENQIDRREIRRKIFEETFFDQNSVGERFQTASSSVEKPQNLFLVERKENLATIFLGKDFLNEIQIRVENFDRTQIVRVSDQNRQSFIEFGRADFFDRRVRRNFQFFFQRRTVESKNFLRREEKQIRFVDAARTFSDEQRRNQENSQNDHRRVSFAIRNDFSINDSSMIFSGLSERTFDRVIVLHKNRSKFRRNSLKKVAK